MGSTLKTKARIILTKLLGRGFNSSKISTLVESADIISFDVFDTLVLRPGIAVPSDLFNLLSTDQSFKAARIEAEHSARDEGKSRGLEDITLLDIYKFLYPSDERERQEAMALEISTEMSVCKANPEAQHLFKSIQSGKYGNKRVVITSDMYLSAATISTILKNCGYDLSGVNVYVSSEYGLTKRSGNLFKKVLNCEKVQKGREGEILHIGDNLISDYINPRRCGMKSYLYKVSRH